MSPQQTTESSLHLYETQVLNKEQFDIVTLTAAGLRELPEDNFDDHLIQSDPSLALAIQQRKALQEGGVDEYSAEIVSAVGGISTFGWKGQIEAYKQRVKEGYQGLGLGFATAAAADLGTGITSKFFYQLWNEARAQFGDAISDFSLLACQCAVVPAGLIKPVDAKTIISNVPFVMDGLKKAGLTDRYAVGILGAHFAYYAALWGYDKVPYDGIVYYFNTLKKKLDINDLSATLLTISPIMSPVVPGHRYFKGDNNRFIDQTEAVYKKAKEMLRRI